MWRIIFERVIWACPARRWVAFPLQYLRTQRISAEFVPLFAGPFKQNAFAAEHIRITFFVIQVSEEVKHIAKKLNKLLPKQTRCLFILSVFLLIVLRS